MIDDREVLAVLRRAMIARIATMTARGRPLLMPLYFVVDDGRILMNNAETSPTVRNIATNPRLVLLVESDGPGHRELRLEGTARFTRERHIVRRLMLRSIAKYYLSPAAIYSYAIRARLVPSMLRYRRERSNASGVIEITPLAWEFL